MTDIEFWDNGSVRGLAGMIRSWRGLDTGQLNIKMVAPERKYLQRLQTLTDALHEYVRVLRSIIKINGKYIFMDSTDRTTLAAESWKLPFDLIVKFQHHPQPSIYSDAIAPVVPFTYTMTYYNMALVQSCRQMRKEALKTKKFTSSMFWAGHKATNRTPRSRAKQYLQKMKHAKYDMVPYSEYMAELATTQVGLSVSGTGDFTHRDIELSSVGNPFVRKTFFNVTRNARLPGVHYHSIGGHEVGIDRTIQHFRDYFEPDGEYRQFTDEEWEMFCQMGENSLKWYEENGSPQGTFNLFREILEEQNII